MGTPDGPPVEAVTFDFWNTLVAEGAAGPHRTRRWLASLGDAGHDVTQEVLERAMTDLWSWFVGQWEGNRVVGPREAVLRALELMEVPPATVLVDEMVDALEEGTDPTQMRIADGIGDTLEALRSAGVRVGIICDVGLSPSTTLRRYLEHHDLLGHFDGWSFSDEVGCYKPDIRIFGHAAEVLGGPAPARTAHVGDLRRTDVAGARGAGWRSVRYRGLFDDPAELPDADVVIDHHRDLLAALGR